MEIYGDIQNILKTLNDEAQEEIRDIIDNAKKYAESKLKQAEREAAIHKRRILKDTEKKIESIKRKISSTLTLEINRMNLKKQGEIVDRVLANLKKKIETFRKDEGYKNFIEALINDALSHLDEKEIELIFDEKDKNILDNNFAKTLIASLQKKGYKVSINDIKYNNNLNGGVIIKSKNKPLIYNNTLESRFNRMKNELILKIYEELFKDGKKLS